MFVRYGGDEADGTCSLVCLNRDVREELRLCLYVLSFVLADEVEMRQTERTQGLARRNQDVRETCLAFYGKLMGFVFIWGKDVENCSF